jgi:CheY-like chemotaxis protein
MNHVLIVDDEADIRESLQAILSEEDYIITTSSATRITRLSCSISGYPTATALTFLPKFAVTSPPPPAPAHPRSS